MTFSLGDSVAEVLLTDNSGYRVGFWERGAVLYVNYYELAQFISKVLHMSHTHSEQ